MPFCAGTAFLFYFHCMNEVLLNGKIISANEPTLNVTNRSFRYGDALFETMKVTNGKIQLVQYHFERLLSGLQLIKIDIPKLFIPEKIVSEILQLCKRNKCEDLARVRLTVFRSDGGFPSTSSGQVESDNSLQYLIECWPLSNTGNQMNENGLVIDVFTDARKSCDKFSNLKSANYQPYVMAALYAKENQLNDCLVLNVHERICDAGIANVFWIKDEIIYTPPLTEGCIAGVMRRYLLEKIQGTRHKVQEKICRINELENADEVFLTNAIQGIRWVRQFRSKNYFNQQIVQIWNEIFPSISQL